MTTTEPTDVPKSRGPGRPAIREAGTPQIGPYNVPAALRDRLIAYQEGAGLGSQAASVRALLEFGLDELGY